MWFRVLSLVIGVALVAKATVALVASRRFYAVRERQYANESLPPKLLVAPPVVIALTLAAWYVTLTDYRPWGWLVTGFLTIIACLSVDHVFRWSSHRRRMLKVVRSPRVWWLDCLLLVIGAGFVVLALTVYS
jgi:small-conductance mechanosensitive channel